MTSIGSSAFSVRWVIGVALAIWLASARVAGAQYGGQTSAPGVEPPRWPVFAWASAGLAVGGVQTNTNGSDFSAALRLSLSAGPVLLTVRDNEIGPFLSSGDVVHDRSVLVGARTPGHNAFISAALGYGNATTRHDCENCGSPSDRAGPDAAVLAYEVMLHGNLMVPGIAISLSGTAGPARASYTSVGVNVELGWFGR